MAVVKSVIIPKTEPDKIVLDAQLNSSNIKII
jgi:hypothetical protein